MSIKRKLFLWLPVGIWLLFIFVMSAAPGDLSNQQSGRLVTFVLWLLSLLPGNLAARVDPAFISFLVRKAAHMTEYAVLFVLLLRALRGEKARRPALLSLLLCAGYAVTDEFHQSFIDGRGPSPADVVIDTCGALGGWVLFRLAQWALRAQSSKSLKG